MGQTTSYKPNDFLFVLNFLENHFNDIKDKNNFYTKLKEIDAYNGGTVPLLHGLLHLCKPNEHAAIVTKSHKEALSKFYNPKQEDSNIENCVKKAGEKLKNIFYGKNKNGKKKSILNDNDSVFYNELIRPLWMDDETDVSDLNLLISKKAVILYGPPGTGKSHTAQTLAQSLLAKHCLKDKDGLIKIDENFDFTEICTDRIKKLQLHANYSYDDFICGSKINNGKIEVVKGKLLEIIDALQKEEHKDVPYILILDEINRTDLSKLFGELFSAIENRDDEVVIPKLGRIQIPQNLYFIGTMNEIDYSLEQIDFALRRRFLWIFKGYNEGVLRSMLYSKDINVADDSNALDFVKKSSALNKKIHDDTSLGSKYEIGHAIFAEIANFVDGDKWKEAKEELWYISIKPLLEAYLGTLSEGEKINKLSDLEKVFFNEGENSPDLALDDQKILEKKRAIILYGPPGTGKTYTAKSLIGELKVNDENVLRLQLHANYSYDDFICGDVLEGEKENKRIVRRAGELLEFIKRIGNKNAVLILDEINRVDISKLFGELFSAIENRGEKVTLPQKVFYKDDNVCKDETGIDSICIPENLYIIGTMNEIDFSLEQVDFALRRRFSWIFKGFNEDELNEIISKRMDKTLYDCWKKNDDSAYKNEYRKCCENEYGECCVALNKKLQMKSVKNSKLGMPFLRIWLLRLTAFVKRGKSVTKTLMMPNMLPGILP